MTIANVVLGGFGNGTVAGDINKLPTLGYDIASNSETVTSATSDGYANGFAATFDNTGATLQAGEDTATIVDLWTVFTITAGYGDTINSAKLTLTAGASDSNTVNLQLKIRSVSSAAPPTSYSDFTTKEATSFTSTVNWTLSGSATIDVTTYESPELATILQAHIDAFPTFDNTLELWVVENTGVGSSGTRTFRSADHSSGHPSLTLTWTDGAAGVTIPRGLSHIEYGHQPFGLQGIGHGVP